MVAALIVLLLLACCSHQVQRARDALLGRVSADERLISAAATLDEPEFLKALAAGADPNARDANGMTALSYAVITGSPCRVARLLEAGADVELANKWGVTPLMFAADNDRAAIAETLLHYGADPRRHSATDETAADRARQRESHEAAAVLSRWSEPPRPRWADLRAVGE
jgi:ankyrin repeat protein